MFQLSILFSIFSLTTVGLAQGSFVVDGNTKTLPLIGLEYVEDKAGTASIDDIASLKDKSWEYSADKVLNFGYTDSAYWVRFYLKNNTKVTKNLILEIGYPALDRIDLFSKTAEGLWSEKRSGDSIPLNQHEIKYNKSVFKINIPQENTKEFFLRFKTEGSIQIPLTLWTNLAFIEKVSDERSGLFLYFGIALVMIVYNLFLFISLREKMYFYYVFWVGSYGLMQMVYTGLAYQYFWPHAPSWGNSSLPFMASLGCFFIVIFTLNFLKLKEYNKMTSFFLRIPAKLCYWVLSATLFVSVANIFLCFFVPYQQMIKLAILPTMVVAPLVLLSGFICWRAKYRPARFFLLAFSLFMVGSFLDAARSFGIVPTTFFTEHGVQIGAALEIILLSLALGDRLKLEHDELLREKIEANKNLVRLYKVKDEFLANTSHELRTPLNGILGFADLINKGYYNHDPKRLMEQVVKISTLAEGLKLQVNTILDLAKSKAEGMQLVNSRISLSDIIDESQLLAESQIVGRDDRTFTLTHSWQKSDNPVFINDHEKVMTLVRNLLSNAFKFCEPSRDNHVSLSFSLTDTSLVITVTDTGIGIPQHDFNKVFEEFKQVDAKTNRAYEGTGLGLAMLKQIIEVMDGQVAINSQLGQGSTFTVTVPKQLRIDLTKSKTPSQDLQTEKSAGIRELDLTPNDNNLPQSQYHILVVDDNPINCEVIHDILLSQGYPITVAFGGREAIAQMEKSKPDLVLLDLMMPDISGEDVIEHCKSTPDLCDIPIIIVTARASQDDRLSVLNIGADEYLAKPIISDEIVLRVRNTVARLELLHTKMEKSELKGQLSAAREVQKALIPQQASLLNGFKVEEYFAPAEAAGGDWYQHFTDKKNQRIYVFLGDVTGHGVSSAIVTGLAYGAIHSVLYGIEEMAQPPSIEDSLLAMNRMVDKTLTGIKHRSGKYMTAVLVGIDLADGTGLLINAGHHGAFIFDSASYQRIFSSGHILGLGSSDMNKPLRFELKKDQSLFLFTDGLIENKGPDGSFLKPRQLTKLIDKFKSDGEIKEKLLDHCQLIWKNQKPDDDCTFLVIKRTEDYALQRKAG